jgi:response regulator RpfG family c-di-GMP phosphodiesterase
VQIETSNEDQTLILPDLEALNVLVVDDEPTIRETLQLFLQNLGIDNTQTAHNGEKALSEMTHHNYDYVFVDLIMPDVNGMEVLKKITTYHQPTSVIIMTGFPSMEIVIDAMHNGASDFLVKPFQFQDVKLTLERIQRVHHLMKKNWLLNQELEKKRELEALNIQLEKRIRLQTIMYSIVDSLSKISHSEELYHYAVQKAAESCNAKKSCFMLYDQVNSSLSVLAQQGLEAMSQGTQAALKSNLEGKMVLDEHFIETYFGKSNGKNVFLDKSNCDDNLIVIPFKIRDEPFGVLMVGDVEGKNRFEEEDEFVLRFLAEKASLNIENMTLYDKIKKNFIASLMSLASAIEAKDPYTQQHSSRVTEFALKISRKMGCTHDDEERIKSSGPLHDIGKIGIKDSILNKTSKLTVEEFDHIKSHPIIGENIVSHLGLDIMELAIIRNHHERWDGNGYPDGLREDDIPRLSRILSVADSFDAMNSNRAYRESLPFSVCLDELKRSSGTQFDPEVVKAALAIFSSSPVFPR